MAEEYVCTVIRRADSSATSLVSFIGLLESNQIEICREVQLGPNATDIFVSDTVLAARAKIAAFEVANNVDIAVQTVANRNKRLVVFDMDSTLIRNECIDLIAAAVGVEAQVSAITEAAMRGELDFKQSLAERVALLKGVPVSIYSDLQSQIELTPGVEQLCYTLKADGVKLAVLSGGFQPVVDWIKKRLNLDYAFANELADDGAVLTGTTVGRIVDGRMKAQLLEEIAEREGIPLAQVLAVGDGSNDLLMMEKAGYGIAWHAKPLVQERAPSRLNGPTLADTLYILGYKSD